MRRRNDASASLIATFVCSGIGLLLIAAPALAASQTSAASCPALSRTIGRGAHGADVAALQRFLISEGMLASGNDTGFFGPLTERAVQAFQSSRGVVSSGSPSTTGYGLAGHKTRAAIATACAGGAASGAPATSPVQPKLANPNCPLVALPVGKPCSGAWREVKDQNGCTASWKCAAQ